MKTWSPTGYKRFFLGNNSLSLSLFHSLFSFSSSCLLYHSHFHLNHFSLTSSPAMLTTSVLASAAAIFVPAVSAAPATTSAGCELYKGALQLPEEVLANGLDDPSDETPTYVVLGRGIQVNNRDLPTAFVWQAS